MYRLIKNKRPFVVLIALLVGLFLFNQNVKADNYLQGDTVESSETISNDIFLNGEEIRLEGVVEGDVFAIGNNIVIDGTVEGSLFTIGQNITVNGAVDGSVYGAGVTFTLGEDAQIGRSMYWVGVHLGLKNGSEIGWDLNGFMMSARLIGSVGRDIKASIGILDLIQFFLNTTDDEFEGVLAPEKTVVAGNEVDTAVSSSTKETIPTKMPDSLHASQTLQQQEDAQASNATQEQLMAMLTLYVTLLIIAAILGWLFPKQLDAWAFQLRDRPIHAAGNGFIGYFMGFISIFFLIALLIAIGLGLFRINLNDLAWLSWGIGFSTIGLGFSLFLALIAYVSKIIVFYTAGTMIFEKVFPAGNSRRAFPLILGLLLYVLLRAIPYFGWALAMIVTWMGIGAVWMAYQAGKQENGTPTAPASPEPEASHDVEEMEKAIAEAS